MLAEKPELEVEDRAQWRKQKEMERQGNYKIMLDLAKKNIKISAKLTKMAFQSLKKYSQGKKEKEQNLLAEEDDFIYVTISLSSVPTKFSPRPIQLPLRHPIYGPEYMTSVCLFVKDPQRKVKNLVQDLDIPCLAKIIGYEKLMKNFHEYKDRRKLINEFDLFFCDSKLYRMLPKVTGSYFYRKKKFPFPIEIKEDGADIAKEIGKSLSCTYMMLGNGPHYTFKAARCSMDEKQCINNIIKTAYKAIPYLLGDSLKPTKVQSITIKTSTSAELPIYNNLAKSEVAAYVKLSQKDDT